MGETFLDRHGIKSGIKLNDVIEEYRYVANGKKVKKGDFLTYVGEDVTPAIEPPFNAVALSSGVGGPEFVEGEVKKTGNIFPTSWNEETKGTKYSSNDGYVLEASSVALATGSQIASCACDGSNSTTWQSADGNSHWIKMICPAPVKITKMNIYVTSNNDSYIPTTVIQGSVGGEDWVDLYSVTEQPDEIKEVVLDNPSFYKYYRIAISLTSSSRRANVFEWQTSEYIVKEQIPSTEHNEQVKIARPSVGGEA